jgi:GDP/UDP-N,N'-diacetylbacillosamine 2-epimerase (hydrolysing)|tara:strand:+ start:249 stop:1415 length:1167 start_codon:yes stop_codon:yes gene_type:complete
LSNKKVCIVTGTRAEYGLLSVLAKKIKNDSYLDLQIVCTGSHLSSEFGSTKNEILKDGFKINFEINLNLGTSDSEHATCLAISNAFKGFSSAYLKLKPDIIIVLGDRYELLAASYAATVHRIPICHIHGGESTSAVIDEATRHSITKMAHIHLVANKSYRNRVIQLGENPSKVFIVGGMGVDVIKNTKLLEKKQLENFFNLKFNKKNFLIIFHPTTLERNTSKEQFKKILSSIKNFKNTNFYFSQSNADPGGKIISKLAKDFVKGNKHRSVFFKSLGQRKFLSLLKISDVLIGNSSCGLLEAPYLKKPVVNIGDRQKNRLVSSNILSCQAIKSDIVKAISKSITQKFKKNLKKIKSAYGYGGASEKSLKIIKKLSYKNILIKNFYDLK